MLTQFVFTNTAFAINLFAAFVFFATGWLYLDSAQQAGKNRGVLVRAVGFFLVAVHFIAAATQQSQPLVILVSTGLEAVGLILITLSLLAEPILLVPGKAAGLISLATLSLIPFSTAGYFALSVIYNTKATKGLEKQLKPAARAFFLIGLYKLLQVFTGWISSDVVFWQQFLADFGPLWIMEHLLLLAGLVVLFKWTWGYLRFRPGPQMFIIVLSSTVIIFLITTVVFTYLLLTNIESENFGQMTTNIHLFEYALERLEEENLTKTKTIALNPRLVEALDGTNIADIQETAKSLLTEYKLDSVLIADNKGQIIVRGEETQLTSDSLADNELFKNALAGNYLSTVLVRESAISPKVVITAAAKTTNDYVVIANFEIDNAFADGIKDITGLEVSLFTDNIRSATSLVSPDGSRFVGSKQTNEKITNTVLMQNMIYTGRGNLFGRNYYLVYAPLMSLQDKTVGMISVAKLQSELVETVRKSTTLTFAGSAALITFSLPVVFAIAKFIREQQEA